MKSTIITAILAFTGTALTACTREGSVELTFYGFPDNDPPSAQTAYNCGAATTSPMEPGRTTTH